MKVLTSKTEDTVIEEVWVDSYPGDDLHFMFDEDEDATSLAWDEDEHPRHEAGDERGGEFAPKHDAPGKPIGWAATASDEERRAAFDELLAEARELKQQQAPIYEEAQKTGDQYKHMAKRRLHAAETKLEFDLATIRYAEFAVNREDFVRIRDALSTQIFRQEQEKEDLMKEAFDEGAKWLPDKYDTGIGLKAKYGASFSDITGNSYETEEKRWSDAQKAGISRKLFDKANAMRTRHYAEENKAALRGRAQGAYYGEPTTVRDFKWTGASDVKPSANLPEKVARGGNQDKELDTFMQNAEVAISVKDTGLKGIISSGQFKNRFEGGRGGVGKGKRDYKEARLEGENKLFGIGHDEDASRPIYGWLEHPDRVSSTGEDIGNNYGPHIVVLKPSVKARSSYTIGDSLDDTNAFGRVAGAVTAPASHTGIVESYWDASLPDDWRSKISKPDVDTEVARIDALPKYEAHARSSWDDDESVRKRAEEIVARRQFRPKVNVVAGNTTNDFNVALDTGRQIGKPRYVEAQIWGGVKLEDIAEIRTRKGSLTPAQEKKLAKNGVAVKYIPPVPRNTIYTWRKDMTWDQAIKPDEE